MDGCVSYCISCSVSGTCLHVYVFTCLRIFVSTCFYSWAATPLTKQLPNFITIQLRNDPCPSFTFKCATYIFRVGNERFLAAILKIPDRGFNLWSH